MVGILSMLNFIEKNGYHDYGNSFSEELRGLIKLELPKLTNSYYLYKELELQHRIGENNLMIQGWKRILRNLERISKDRKNEVIVISFKTERNLYMGIVDCNLTEYIGMLKFEGQKIVYKNELGKNKNAIDKWSKCLLFLDKEFIPNKRFHHYEKMNHIQELKKYKL